MHVSLPIEGSIEFLNIAEISPLISKCQIKVCAVGDTPNRNGSVITKNMGKELAKTLPGSPIVGFYNAKEEDFEGHNQTIEISGGDFVVKDTTIPYGFVDLNAEIYFQKFLDDDQVIREYLITDGFLWTGQFPEAQRVIDQGNNQSMELDDDSIKGTWSKDVNSNYEFFIFNEAIISKLCILGEDVEPCFEGSQIKLSFSHNFQDNLFSLLEKMKQKLDEGGEELMAQIKQIQDNKKVVTDFSLETEEKPTDRLNTPEGTFEAKDKEEKPKEDLETEEKPKEEFATEPEKKDGEEEKPEEDFEASKEGKEEKPKEEFEVQKDDEELKNQGQNDSFNLEENSIYIELKNNFDALTQNYNALKEEFDSLLEFKKAFDLKEKQAMIDNFTMLSEEDKKEVVENIDKYSVSDIEAKLSVILVRTQAFSAAKDSQDTEDVNTVFNIDGINQDNSGPQWLIRAREKQNSI